MEIRQKVFCPKCYDKVNYKIESSVKETSVREVSFNFLETRARCVNCNEVVYVPAINDKNYYERHKAYYEKLDELKETR